MDLTLVSAKKLLDEFGKRHICVIAWLEYESGQEVVKVDYSKKGKFIEKAGLISCLQNDFYEMIEEDGNNKESE